MTAHGIIACSVFVDVALAGLFLGSCLVEHAMRNNAAGPWVIYKQSKEAVFGPVMPALFGAGLLLAIAAAVVSRAHIAYGAAAVLMLVVLIITVTIHLPLNRLFQAWLADDVPANWSALRRRWRIWNWVRFAAVAAASVIAFTAFS